MPTNRTTAARAVLLLWILALLALPLARVSAAGSNAQADGRPQDANPQSPRPMPDDRKARLVALLGDLGVSERVKKQLEEAGDAKRRQAERAMRDLLRGLDPSPAMRSRFDAIAAAHLADYRARAEPSAILSELAERLGDALDDADISAALAFYESPLFTRLVEARTSVEAAEQQIVFDRLNTGEAERRRALRQQLRSLRDECNCAAPAAQSDAAGNGTPIGTAAVPEATAQDR